MLMMIPDEFLDNDVLLGPSKPFSSGLCEEDDDLRIIPLGRTCEVLVIDVSDEVIGMLSDYDPVTHEFENCASFDLQRPAALPIGTDIMDNIKIWMEGVTETRMNFYSAREEPEPAPKVSAKKGPPKKITNQAIMEQLWKGSREIRLHLPLLQPLPSLQCPLLQRCRDYLLDFKDLRSLWEGYLVLWDLLRSRSLPLFQMPSRPRRQVEMVVVKSMQTL